MKTLFTSLADLSGAGLIGYGFWLAWPPLGFIATGLALLLFSLHLERRIAS